MKEGIENNADYKKSYDYVKGLYLKNPEFEKDIDDATKQVLVANPFRKKEIESADVKIGTHYILSEFAFMLFLPMYLNYGHEYVYAYHKSWPVFEKFIAGYYDGQVKSNLKFLKLPDFS